MFSSDNSIGGFHNDVLDAVPIDDESSMKLIEEIKNRAKGSISSQNYPVAITLYSKAIDICPPNSQGARAILLSNRSLCHFSMSNLDSAIDDADNSILADSSYLKGYFRAVQGLLARATNSDLDTAHTHLLHCLTYTPEDKAFKKQLVDVEKKIESKKSSGSNDSKTVKKEETKNPANPSNAISTKIEKKNTECKKAVKEEEDDKEVNENKIRGYKLTTDGRKTTFFNNEMDEQTKALIGNIAPQKIECSDVTQGGTGTGGQGGGVSNGGSAWNAAGTFESVDHSKWAMETLQQLMENITVDVTTKDVLESVILKDVTFEGDAQVIGMRGKRKHVCDFTATINWTINCASNIEKTKTEKQNNTEQEISNMEISKDDNKTNSSVENKEENVLKMIVRDITSDGDYEFENIYPRFSTTFKSNEKSALVNHVNLLQKSVIETLRNFLDAFSLK